MDKTTAGRIRKLRKARKISQGELAKMMGVSPGAISRWESGQREPNGAVLKYLETLEAK